MTKEEIMNTYAIKHGHEGWWGLLHYCMKNGNLQYHINAVTDLIQEELLKKASERAVNKFLQRHINWGELEKEILNTEIL